MEEAGTMEELEELIAACEKREIVVMMDLVLIIVPICTHGSWKPERIETVIP